MNLDKINDIEILRNLLKKTMVRLKEDIETPNKIYHKGEWYFYTQDDDGVFLYWDDPTLGLLFSYDEADKYIEY